MIDTTTINYALGKLSEAYHSVAPNVGQISEKYVKYIVWEQILFLAFSLMWLLFSTILLTIGFMVFRNGTKNDSENKLIIGTVGMALGGIGIIICAICISVNGFNAVMAYKNPEFFAIERLISGAKR